MKIEKTTVTLDGKSILVTGAAGFIGSNLCARLLRDTQGATIVGIDCMTDYNPLELKEYRLRKVEEAAQSSQSRWVFIRGDIANKPLIDELFATYRFHVLVNLAAQAGVRYSIDHPDRLLQPPRGRAPRRRDGALRLRLVLLGLRRQQKGSVQH